jgi:hypothetical protein
MELYTQILASRGNEKYEMRKKKKLDSLVMIIKRCFQMSTLQFMQVGRGVDLEPLII